MSTIRLTGEAKTSSKIHTEILSNVKSDSKARELTTRRLLMLGLTMQDVLAALEPTKKSKP